MYFGAQARLSNSRGDPMTEAKLNDLITMLDFFDPELPVYVAIAAGQPIYRIVKVKKTQDEKQVVLWIEQLPGDVRIEEAP
jgi:hypothetical protein